MTKKLNSFLLILFLTILAGLSACNSAYQIDDPYNFENSDFATLEHMSYEFQVDKHQDEDNEVNIPIDANIEEHYDLINYEHCLLSCDIEFSQDVQNIDEHFWGSWDPPQNSEFLFVTNNNYTMENYLIREVDEFLGFTLEKIYQSIIELWDGQPGMQHTAHASFTGGELIATGNIVVELYDFDDCDLPDMFIFFPHEQYFSLFPGLVGDRTAGDAPFNIINTYDIIKKFGLVRPESGLERIIIEDVTVRVTEITLKGRRMDCASHSAIIEICVK